MAETPATKRRKSDRENRFAWKDPDWEPPESFADCVTKWLEASDGTAATPDTAMAFNFHSRDAENFVPSVHITMETFQKSLTLAHTRGIGIRTNPGLALTLLNNLTPRPFPSTNSLSCKARGERGRSPDWSVSIHLRQWLRSME